MGFTSQNKQSNNTTYSNITSYNTSYKIGGLIFESVIDYSVFKTLEENINLTVDSVKSGLININDVYNNVMPINVKEEYPEAREELDELFINATELLCYNDEGTKVAKRFFNKIKVIDYL